MKKFIITFIYITSSILANCQIEKEHKIIPMSQFQEENDSVVWQIANRFCSLFNSADSNSMKRFLPDDFLLQWMHENFIGKKNLINTMKDSAARNAMAYIIKYDMGTMIRYSDDQSAASINTIFDFIDSAQKRSVESQRGYGLCIFYLRQENGGWVIETIHIDVHCSLCNF